MPQPTELQSPPLPTPAETERALREVYARPEFAPPSPSPIREWLADVWNGFREFLAGLFPGVQLGEGSGRLLFWMIIALLAITALGIAIHLAGVATGRWRARDRSRAGVAKNAGVSPPLRAEDWEARAGRAAEEGRWREAALALYQALLLRLHDRGAVRYDPAKTPGEYRREVRGDPEAKQTLNGFLRLWEPVAFGGRALDAAGWEMLRSAAGGAGTRG